MTDMVEFFRVELVQSVAPRQTQSVVLSVPAGSTVKDALGMLTWALPESFVTGIWGRKAALSHKLHDGDRLEIYRPLLVDPKEARRLRYDRSGTKRRISGNKRYHA